VLSNKSDDLLRREADIAVRMVRPTQDALFARKVGVIHLGLFAHRSFLQKHGVPTSFGEAGKHSIGFDRESSIPRAEEILGLPLSREFFAFRSDSDLAQLAAIRAGFGIGGCQIGLARRDPNLVQLFHDLGFKLETWVVMHEDLKSSRRMRLMFDHLVAELTDYVATSQPDPAP